MTDPIVIVNAYDIMWHDTGLRPDDPNPFFFKENPIAYLRNLHNAEWRIFIYWEPIDQEVKTRGTVYTNPKNVFNGKLEVIRQLSKDFATILADININDTLKYIILNFHEPASFAIIDSTREFIPGISRYTPIEIFELVGLPQILPGTIIRTYSNSSYRNVYVDDKIEKYINDNDEKFKRYDWGMSATRKGRRDQIQETQRKNPNRPILMIWNPIYRYPPDYRPIDANPQWVRTFDRPDQDNFPGVQVYVWGF